MLVHMAMALHHMNQATNEMHMLFCSQNVCDHGMLTMESHKPKAPPLVPVNS